MRDDFRFALRMLTRFKLYTAAAVTTLALGIGTATGVFSVIDATLLRPLPFREPGRLVGLNSAQADVNGEESPFALSQFELVRWRMATSTLETIEGLESRTLALTGTGEPATIPAAAITSGLFPMLGVKPMFGRVFTAEKERQNAGVVILSHTLWSQRFNADRAVLGRAITIGEKPYVVVGVMPANFRLLLDLSGVLGSPRGRD